MNHGFSTAFAYGKSDSDWLVQLLSAVPLHEGRMEIVADWRAVAAHLVLGGGGAAFLWAVLMLHGDGDRLGALVVFAAALAATAFTIVQARRLLSTVRRHPVLILSSTELVWKGERLAWNTITDIAWRANTLGGHSRHDCRLTLGDGGTRAIRLDQMDLPPRRVMLLIDFYWSGAQAGSAKPATAAR